MEHPIILIVSDSRSKTDFLRKTLKDRFQLVESYDGKEALDVLIHTGIDFIIIDDKIPDMPALNLSRQIRRTKGHENTPILLISSILKQSFISESLNAGVSDFLNEPLDEGEINKRMAVAVKSQDTQKKMGTLISHLKPPAAPEKTLKQRFLLGDVALKEISKAKKSKSPVSLLIIELDNYPDLRKKWGDLPAEEILISLTALLNTKLRSYDALFPQGGGRYILLLPKTSHRAALEIAEIIRSEVHENTFKTKKAELNLTVSIGFTSFNEGKETTGSAYENFDRLLEQVEHALSEAKEKGNRIVFKKEK